MWANLTTRRDAESWAGYVGFRTALEMFRADPRDPKRDHLLRGWAVLPDEARTRVLRFLNRLLTGDTD